MQQDEYKNLPKIITDVPGPESKLLLQRQKEMESNTVTYPDSFPIAIKRAENSLIEDHDIVAEKIMKIKGVIDVLFLLGDIDS